MSLPDLEALGEDAVLLRFGSQVDASLNRLVHAWAAAIASRAPPWLQECVPAYATLALVIDRQRLSDPDGDPLPMVRQWLSGVGLDVVAPVLTDTVPATGVCEIPVCYDAAFAPDLEALARHAGLDSDEAVARHTGALYSVAMIGFAPGFPYLLGLDPVLAMPRMATPRTRVPAGSVAIGGAQAGIYPRESPGGWRIIGRTPLTLFDANQREPSLLRPGQAVRFVAIDRTRFDALAVSP